MHWLVEFEEIATGVFEEGLPADTGDDRRLADLEAFPGQLGSNLVEVSDLEREVLTFRTRPVSDLDEVDLTTVWQPKPGAGKAKVRPVEQLQAEYIEVEALRLHRVGDVEGHMVHALKLHVRSLAPQASTKASKMACWLGSTAALSSGCHCTATNHAPDWSVNSSASTSPSALAVLRPLRPFGSTAIYDAIAAALPLIEARRRPRAALLVVSDGADTASDTRLPDLRSQLLRSDAFVYAVAIDAPDRRPINAPINPAALAEITDQSGGRTRVVHSSDDLSAAFEEITKELNSQYLIGYSSGKGADGKYHSIRVRVRGTDDRVRARSGYVATPRR